ncbi:hypothetical protein D3C85_934740 [compost metagenome]
MVLQVFPYPRQVGHYGNAQCLQLRGRANARHHQQLGRLDCPGAHQHFVAGLGNMSAAIVQAIFDAAGAAPFEHNALHQGPLDQLQVGPAQGRLDGITGDRRTPAVPIVDLENARAPGLAIVEIVHALQPCLGRSLDHRVGHRVHRGQITGGKRPPTTMQGVADALLVFSAHEIRQQLRPAPAAGASADPVGVILLVATDVDHPVDRRRATHQLAARHHHAPPARVFLRLGLVHPGIPGVVGHGPPTCRHADEQLLVAAAGFEQQHPVAAVLTQARGQCSTRRAGPHHDVVECFRQNCSPHYQVNDAPCSLARAGQRSALLPGRELLQRLIVRTEQVIHPCPASAQGYSHHRYGRCSILAAWPPHPARRPPQPG